VQKRLFVSVLTLVCVTCALVAQDTRPASRQVPPDKVQPLLINKVAPTYPPLARQARIQGTVILSIIITKAGDVDDVKLVSGHPMLVPAVIDAVKQWKYRPYEENGEPIAIQTTIQVNFTLADKSPAGSILAGTVGDPPAHALGLVRVCEEVPAGSPPGRVRASQGLIQSVVISKQAPNYPDEARKRNVEGTVQLALEIAKDGAVCDVTLLWGDHALALAAIDAVRQWKFRPYILNGFPAEFETQVEVNFTLKR